MRLHSIKYAIDDGTTDHEAINERDKAVFILSERKPDGFYGHIRRGWYFCGCSLSGISLEIP